MLWLGPIFPGKKNRFVPFPPSFFFFPSISCKNYSPFSPLQKKNTNNIVDNKTILHYFVIRDEIVALVKLITYKETHYLTCAFSSFHTSFVLRIVFAWNLRFQIVHAVLCSLFREPKPLAHEFKNISNPRLHVWKMPFLSIWTTLNNKISIMSKL